MINPPVCMDGRYSFQLYVRWREQLQKHGDCITHLSLWELLLNHLQIPQKKITNDNNEKVCRSRSLSPSRTSSESKAGEPPINPHLIGSVYLVTNQTKSLLLKPFKMHLSRTLIHFQLNTSAWRSSHGSHVAHRRTRATQILVRN